MIFQKKKEIYIKMKLKFLAKIKMKLLIVKFGYFLMKLIHAIHWDYYLKFYVKKPIGIILLMIALYLLQHVIHIDHY